MTADQTCALPGCNKPCFPSPRCFTPPLACSNLHHLLLMAGRFNPTLPHPHQQILDRNFGGLCALPSCLNPPHPEHPWCSRSHYCSWLHNFTASLHPDQICKLFPDCTRHVFVNEDGSPSEFCGWHHCQKYVMRSAMQRNHRQWSEQQRVSSSLPFTESGHGHFPSVESLLQSFREYALSAKASKFMKVDDDFFAKHPWDVSTEGLASLLIVPRKYTSKGKRVMVTKDNYRWKQQGPPASKGGFTRKYFTYRRLKGKENYVSEHDDGWVYHMDEYTVEDVKNLSLVKLRKAIDGPGRRRKGRSDAYGKHSGADVTGTYSSTTLLPQIDEMSSDSPFCNQSTLVDWPYIEQFFCSSLDTEETTSLDPCNVFV